MYVKRNSLIFLFLVIFFNQLNAATLKGGYEACISENLFDQFQTAYVKQDKKALEYLLSHGCTFTKPGSIRYHLDRKS